MTVTSSSVVAGPSSARARSTYVPGTLNVTFVVTLPSLGIGGANHTGAHRELAPTRKSPHVLIRGEFALFSNQDGCSDHSFKTVRIIQRRAQTHARRPRSTDRSDARAL